jgi:hypothetical protein
LMVMDILYKLWEQYSSPAYIKLNPSKKVNWVCLLLIIIIIIINTTILACTGYPGRY